MIKVFDILSFDMSNMISAKHIPTAAAWLNGNTFSKRIAVADADSGIIRIYQSEGKQEPIHEITFHSTPVKYMSLNIIANTIISVDSKGVLEYWDVDSYTLPIDKIKFSYKSETDLYEHAKSGTIPFCIAISPKGNRFATISKDKQIRVFDFETGKLRKKYNESSSVYTSGAQNVKGSDSLDIGRRVAIEKELESLQESLALSNLTFDESGNFLIYGSLGGIKMLNLYNNRVARTIGTSETGERFLAIALYQGIPVVDTQYLLSKKNNSDQILTAAQLHVNPSPDPTIYCTSFKKRRFYCFSRRDPDESEEIRDVLNEKPNEEERQTIVAPVKTKELLAKEMVLRTTMGDIHIKLFVDDCPKTVENFVTHSKNGYYNNVIFHRVIKGFMVQTGDPLGNGTGGESIWGGEFKDEFVKTLKHDKPYTLSMANSGPNSNGSQFFITTVPTPWLDNKHTVFGRVTSGYEVVSKIENIKVNKLDKPYDDIKILQIDVINN
jgi:peptidylprolyl isomerase domain and WD repeat-containing protein 1